MKRVRDVAGNFYLQLFLITVAIVWTLGLKTSNVFVVILLVLLYQFLKEKQVEQSRIESCIVTVLSFLFACLWVAGNYDGYQNEGILLIIQYAISVWGLYLIIRRVLAVVFHWIISLELYTENGLNYKPWKIWMFVFAICIICWIPYFLAYYPGIVTDDAEWQLAQAIGLSSYSNHQPWIHTMMHRLFYNIGFELFQTPNAGVATCVAAQMCVIAGTFAYLVMTLYKARVHRVFVVGCVVYFALVPFNALYSVTLWKDVLIGAVVLLFSLSIWKMTLMNIRSAGNYILFFITGLLLCVLRSNGFYAYLLCIPFFALFMKKKRRVIIPICLCTVFLTMFYKGPVLTYYNVVAPDTIESLSIPAQHIARVIKDGGTLTDEQRELLENVVDVEKIPEVYDGTISDPIKTLVRESGNQDYILEHKGEFFKLWLQLGLEYPGTYMKAQIDQTKGYWYPDVQYWVTTTMMKENDWGMYRDRKLPDFIVSIMKYAEVAYTHVPVLGLLWSIGFYTWVVFIMCGAAFYRKNSLLCFLPVLAILASLFIATPVQAEFRYSYAMMTTMPLFLVTGCGKIKEKAYEKNSSSDSMLQ